MWWFPRDSPSGCSTFMDIIARFMIFVHESGFCCMVHMYFHLGELGTIFYDSKVNLRMGSNGKSLDSQGIPSLT